MLIQLHNFDNMEYENYKLFDIIYGDCIYESNDLDWVNKYWEMLKPNGILIIQTDYHTDYKYRTFMIGFT